MSQDNTLYHPLAKAVSTITFERESCILITGAKGQLGCEVARLLPQAFATDIEELDITNQEQLNTFVKQHDIELIINCAAYTNVDKAEEEVELCYALNETAAANLAKTGCKLIHVSTDYVFDGHNYCPYQCDDNTNPLSVYGKSKCAGEEAILQANSSAMIIRTAWLYSAHHRNFVKTIQNLAAQRESLNVVSDQIGSPTYAPDFATALVLSAKHMLHGNNCVGIYHFTNEGVCSWYDLAVEVVKQSKLNCHINPIPSKMYPTKATRPFYSVLSKDKLKDLLKIQIPHWQEALTVCLKQY